MPPSAGDLCRACGMCCDGTLFQHGTLAEAEVSWALGHGFAVVRGDRGAPAFRQPCPALGVGGCSVYPERPGTCRAFRCRLLVAHEGGQLTIDECLEVVDEVRAAVGELEHTIGLPPGAYDRRRFRRLLETAVRGEDLDGAEALHLASAKVQALVGEHFLPPADGDG